VPVREEAKLLPAPTRRKKKHLCFFFRRVPVRGIHYFGNSKNATVPAAAPRIIVKIIATTNPTCLPLSGCDIIVTGPEVSSLNAGIFF